VADRFIFWDFDGTLGYRQGGMWGASMMEALREYDPNTTLVETDFREFLITGFPWHDPKTPHRHIRTPDEWWSPILKIFYGGFVYYQIPEGVARNLADRVREKFINLKKWKLFDDTLPTLDTLSTFGWKHAIVSNHIPELDRIVSALGLMDRIEVFVNSAVVGYEKPNPAIFQLALDEAGDANDVWMVGDNIDADVLGAEVVGIRSILVRKSDPRARRCCESLGEVIEIIGSVGRS
jgi:putative hydrolase of the HAD superfamily